MDGLGGDMGGVHEGRVGGSAPGVGAGGCSVAVENACMRGEGGRCSVAVEGACMREGGGQVQCCCGRCMHERRGGAGAVLLWKVHA